MKEKVYGNIKHDKCTDEGIKYITWTQYKKDGILLKETSRVV